MEFVEGIGTVLIALLVAAGGIFLTLLTAFATAYIFGYGFTFGSVAAKRRMGIMVVHALEDKIERPFKEAAQRAHKAEDVIKRDVNHDEHVVKDDIHKLDK